MNPKHRSSIDIDWLALFLAIRHKDPWGEQQLARIFATGIRWYLARNLGKCQLDDRVQQTLTDITNTIRADGLSDPESMVSLVRTILQKQVAQNDRPEATPKAPQSENVALLVGILKRLPALEREALTRFYLDREPSESICQQLKISNVSLTLLLAGVKARFEEQIASRSMDSYKLEGLSMVHSIRESMSHPY
jgi:DNA-directed RNA polymerase specialized sigma24 family protein